MLPTDHKSSTERLLREDQSTPLFTEKAPTPRVASGDNSQLSVEALLYKLQVQQIELVKKIDQLQHVEFELVQAREQFAQFYEFAPVGYLTLNDKGMINEINLSGASLLGVERDKLLRKHLSRFVSPDNKNRWTQYFTDALDSNIRLGCDLVFMKNDGSNSHLHFESTRVLNVGNETLVRCVLTDISKLKQAEYALRDQEVFFKMISENSDEFIAVLDLKGRRLYSSRSWAKLIQNIDSMIGTDAFAEIHPEDRKYFRQVFDETIKTGNNMQANYRFVLADGSVRHMESKGTLVRSSSGVALRVVIVSRDITERLEAAEEISNLALYDTLTGKSNRRLLRDRLDYVMTANKRKGSYGALLIIHLDRLKIYNELNGKVASDLILVEAARRISSCVREVDTVSRLGNEEFVVLIGELSVEKDKSAKEAGIVAEKVRLAMSATYSLTIRKENKADAILLNVNCPVRLGVFQFSSNDGTADEILERAEKATNPGTYQYSQ